MGIMPVPPIQLVNPNNERRRQPDVLDPMHCERGRDRARREHRQLVREQPQSDDDIRQYDRNDGDGKCHRDDGCGAGGDE
jgi:hypothetical protein